MKIAVLLALLLLCANLAGDESAHSITFAQAAERAVSASIDLRSEHRALQIRENAWVLGLRSFFPRLNLSVQENDRLQEIGPDSFMKNYSVTMDQLLFDGGRLVMSRRLERMELDMSGSRLERMADEIAEAALFAYRSVLSARTILAIRETALESLEGQFAVLEREVELGLALPLDLAEAELTLAQARMEIMLLHTDLTEMEHQFADLLGLDVLPELAEQIDINRSTQLPSPQVSIILAGERNPDLAEARFSIVRRQAEYRFASRTWIPTLRLNGSFGLSGQQYPLTRYIWSVGLSIEFASPWLNNTFAVQAGRESSGDQTALLHNNASLVPDPVASLGKRQIRLLLDLEREKYSLAFEYTGRFTQRALERCMFADRRRSFAVEAIRVAAQRYNLEEIRLNLGQITRLELMQAYIDCTEKEILAVESAIALMNAERELERILDLRPGELSAFAQSTNLQAAGGDIL